MIRNPKINGQSPLRKRGAKRPSARQRIFDKASELFYLKGIRAVGVETIAAEADTTKMSLYRNFPSKDELVAEWLREHDANFWETWDAMASRHPRIPAGRSRLPSLYWPSTLPIPRPAAAPWRMRRWKLPRKITPREK